MIAPGLPAPDFSLPATTGGIVTLSTLRPQKVVLFFLPRAGTATCLREAQEFGQLLPEFRKGATELIGISPDTPSVQARVAERSALPVTLLADADARVARTYGFWGEKVMYGRRFMGVRRSTVLIDGAGRVVQVWSNVRVEGHAAAVLEAVQAHAERAA